MMASKGSWKTADRRYSFFNAAGGVTALDATCLQHIARFKRPKQYRLVAAVPKNHYGEVLKTTLREQRTTGEKAC